MKNVSSADIGFEIQGGAVFFNKSTLLNSILIVINQIETRIGDLKKAKDWETEHLTDLKSYYKYVQSRDNNY